MTCLLNAHSRNAWARAQSTSYCWMIRILDPDWLAQQLPPNSKGPRRLPLPSVSEDRIRLKGIAHLARQKGKVPRPGIREAAHRASVRDKEWLDREVARGKKGLLEAESRAPGQGKKYFPCARRATAALLGLPGLTTTSLARAMVRLRLDRLQYFESQAVFMRRAIPLAYEQLKSKRLSTVPSAVLKYLSLRASQQNVALVTRAMRPAR